MTRRASQSSCGSAVSLKQASLLRASRSEVTRSNTAKLERWKPATVQKLILRPG